MLPPHQVRVWDISAWTSPRLRHVPTGHSPYHTTTATTITSSSNQLSLAELVEDADDDLFSQVLYNNSHVLNSLLPMANTITYNLRQRSHNRTLVAKTSSLTERDFNSECCTNAFINCDLLTCFCN